MPQCLLVLHELEGVGPAARKAFFDAIFETGPEHWPMHAERHAGGHRRLPHLSARPPAPGPGCRGRAGGDAAGLPPSPATPPGTGLPPEGEAWLQEVLAEG